MDNMKSHCGFNKTILVATKNEPAIATTGEIKYCLDLKSECSRIIPNIANNKAAISVNINKRTLLTNGRNKVIPSFKYTFFRLHCRYLFGFISHSIRLRRMV